MTNEEKYKTAEERLKAFHAWCKQRSRCIKCELDGKVNTRFDCPLFWLSLEAEEEKPELCPFCGGETHGNLGHLKAGVVHYWVDCISPDCMYRSAHYTDKDEAIAAHNRVARAVKASTQPAQPVRPPDVQGEVYLGSRALTALPLQPETVGGSFSCAWNKLTSLAGAPTTVGGDFDCTENALTSLDGAPTSVGGDLYCSYNKLTSLDGAPVKVGGIFYCGGNPELTEQQIYDYVAFIRDGGNDPAHIDETGHYCEKARESEVAK